MKKLISILLTVCLMLSMVAVGAVTVGATGDNRLITVGVIGYLYDDDNPTTGWQVHYWGSGGTGDANANASKPVEVWQKSLGSDYWNGASKSFYMFTAEIPSDATGYKVHNGNRWFGDDGTVNNTYAYVFSYDTDDGNPDKAIYEATKNVDEPTGSDPTEPSSSEPAEDVTSYYVVGNFSGWETNENYKMRSVSNDPIEEYKLSGVALSTLDQFKIVGVDGDGEWTWFPEGMGTNYGENGEIDHNDMYDIYFRPHYGPDEAWFYDCIKVMDYVPETSDPTEPSSTVPSSSDTYIVAGEPDGIFGNRWDGTDENNKMTKGADGVYSKTYTVTERYNVELKVVKNGSTWIGDATGNNVKFKLTGAGTFTVKFDPATEAVSVEGDIVAFSGLTFDSVYVAGNDGAVFGSPWNPADPSSKMTETNGIWEITYTDVPYNADLKFKFTPNGSWSDSFGGTCSETNGAWATAVYGGFDNNIAFKPSNLMPGLSGDKCRVVIKFNTRMLDPDTKTGATFSVTVGCNEHKFGDNPEPKWSWASDMTSATATFTCPDCGMTESVKTEIDETCKRVVDNKTIFTAQVEFEGQPYYDVYYLFTGGDDSSSVAGHSLSLLDGIGVNFYLELDHNVANNPDAYVAFSIPTGGEPEYNAVEVPVSEAKVVDNWIDDSNAERYYVFSCPVAAKEMNSHIYAEVIVPGQIGAPDSYTYTVCEYANYLIQHAAENDEYRAAAPLVIEMLIYGAYAQKYFERNPDDLAFDITDIDLSGVDGVVSYNSVDIAGTRLPENVSFIGTTLSLRSLTTLTLFLKIEGGNAEDYTFESEDGYEITTETSGDIAAVRIKGIAPADLGRPTVVNIIRPGNTASVNDENVAYVPTNYIYKVLNGGSDDEALKNLVRALFSYYQAADSYFQQSFQQPLLD